MTQSNSPAFSDSALARFIGVPFISHGREPARGLDCWGLVLAASRELFGRELPDYAGYCDARQVADVAPLFAARADWCERASGLEKPGDVVVLRIIGHATHAGLVVRPGVMLHAMLYCNSVLEGYRGLRWAGRLEGFYTWQPR